MAATTARDPQAAQRTVEVLAAAIEAELDPLVDGIVARIREELPEFRRIPTAALQRGVGGNVRRALRALGELRPPTPEELEGSAAIGRERAEQGLPVDTVLHAYRITVTAVWSRLGELARERGADVGSVLAFSETLWLWADAVMEVVAGAHRAVELERTREEQQLRDAFVFAVLMGTSDAAELRRDGAAFGVDPDRAYVPFRARAAAGRGGPVHRLALALAGDDGLVAPLDHDLIGFAPAPPAAPAGVCVGVGPPSRIGELAAAFALAVRAFRTALAFGQEGVLSLGDLSIRPAILDDDDLGDAFVARYLDPLDALGRHGGELETTLRTWLDQGMRMEETARALHVHPNTLRHRLKRFEEATGADVRRTTDVVELWWALEHRRLSAQPPAAAPPGPSSPAPAGSRR